VILSLKEIQSLRTTKFNYIAALDAARLASAAQPESLEFRKEIYINLFMLTKTQEALNEIAKIEKITGTLPKAIACDAVMLSRNAKLKDLEAKYTPICKK
jgi:hypothetical protein